MLAYNKVCNIDDFRDPELRELMRSIFAHEIIRFGSNFPDGVEYRKHWEVAMAVRAFRDLQAMQPSSEILGVGAGSEPTIFYLTNFVKRVFATDLYLASGRWQESASVEMLREPAKYWPFAWNPRRLVVQHMNALNLMYEDSSFDAIFSSSSIEHFGSFTDVRRAMSEMCRVLRPGGIVSLSTEFRLSGSGDLPGTLLFDVSGIHEHLVGNLPWKLTSPIDSRVSKETLNTETDFEIFLTDNRKQVAKHGELLFHEHRWSRYPHVVLRHEGKAWTSVHLTIQKSKE
jgi:SAM-dependent methyltransferase